MMPPRELVTAASMTNCRMMVPLSAPRDLRIPISLVLSVTDTSMMFMTPTPATSREIPAIPPSMPLIMAICSFRESSISLMAVTRYKSSSLKVSYRKFLMTAVHSSALLVSSAVKV